MHSDAFFTIGRTHAVCQDYAAAVAPGQVVLSDGCSSSPHTDFGARLLCRFAVNHGPALAPFLAEPVADSLGLDRRCLDATVLSAEAQAEGAEVLSAGDGVVVGLRRHDAGLDVWHYRYSAGAPRYASYDLSPRRRTKYLAEFADNYLVTEVWSGDERLGDTSSVIPDGPCEPERLWFPYSDYDMVLILSDGADSFVRPDGNGGFERVPVIEVVQGLCAFKGFAGEFVQRRARRFLKDVAALGWAHDDDLSVAAIYFLSVP